MSKENQIIRSGTILLAEPFMQENMFGRAAILICHHDAEGSIGLILNKPAANPFSEDDADHPLKYFSFYAGGPVEVNNMFYFHQLTYLPEAVLLKDGICWQGNYDALLEAITEKAFTEENGRFFIGYSGWGEGQLEAEIKSEDWMVYNGPIDDILTVDSSEIWKHLLKKMGPYYKMVSNFPTDPNLN